MYSTRKPLIEQLEQARGSRVLVYVTGDRRGMETRIGSDTIDNFVHHLDRIGVVPKLTFFLYTRGGETLAAWCLANLLRSFCDTLEVIVPSKALSAGTLISLGADKIVMTKQATLGPIDPSVNTPLNPQLQGAQPSVKVPVSVEDVNGFIEFARESLGKDANLSQAFERLAQSVHPIVLGTAFRTRTQIRMLGRRLLSTHMTDDAAIDQILGFLCSESGSHDYTINRREARDALGLPVETPSAELYALIKALYDDIADELELGTSYDPNVVLAGGANSNYSLVRALIETHDGGSHAFVSEGRLTRQQIQVQPGLPGEAIQDQRQFEGWRLRNA